MRVKVRLQIITRPKKSLIRELRLEMRDSVIRILEWSSKPSFVRGGGINKEASAPRSESLASLLYHGGLTCGHTDGQSSR